MKSAFLKFRDAYIQFAEKQGFPIIVTVCVAIITATAFWTRRSEAPYVAPTPPVQTDVSAAQLLQQSLRDAATPTPAPTAEPRTWTAPLEECTVLQGFSTETMVQYTGGLWAVHAAVDLQADKGAQVHALADGVVLAAGSDPLQGVWLRIDHGDGVEALYAGLALAGAYLPGDKVRTGDTIGYAGSGMATESALGDHLHLQVTRDGAPVDPVSLWAAST